MASAVNLELWRHGGMDAIAGGFAERVRRSVQAVYGWRGMLASLAETGRLGRILPSQASVMPQDLSLPRADAEDAA